MKLELRRRKASASTPSPTKAAGARPGAGEVGTGGSHTTPASQSSPEKIGEQIRGEDSVSVQATGPVEESRPFVPDYASSAIYWTPSTTSSVEEGPKREPDPSGATYWQSEVIPDQYLEAMRARAWLPEPFDGSRFIR
jgi:hypothetical protein